VDKLGFPGDVCRVKKWGFCPLDAVGREMGGVNNKEEIITSMKQSGVDDYIITGNVDMVGTGVSVTNLSYGVYCGIGKSTYVAIQTTGRIIRKHDEIPHAVIFDIRDDLQTNNKKVPQYARWSYSMAHSIARYETYKYEDYKMHDKGVTINI
jgi:superfamily II DNA or RNA helicase